MPYPCPYCDSNPSNPHNLRTHLMGRPPKGHGKSREEADQIISAIQPTAENPRSDSDTNSAAGLMARSLSSSTLAVLRRLACAPGDHWWKDLLFLWRPSGAAAGSDGLRLALRENDMNFYRFGQSVAKVGFDQRGAPQIKVHVKYAFGPQAGNGYARLAERTIVHPNGTDLRPYEGIKTLREWIREADTYAGDEKRFVDGVVADNDAVIDVEMGLPAFGKRRAASRIDLVALELFLGFFRIVFWEAKLINDSRLVAVGEPEVCEQIRNYREYLDDAARKDGVLRAYANTCLQLVELYKMAKQVNPNIHDLGASVCAVAANTSKLNVDSLPRLLIFDNGKASGTWATHLERLRAGVSGEPISCQVGRVRPYTLLPREQAPD